jgi:epsin
MPIHRTIKNVVKNYTFAEVKVREATSNDPWGPSTTLMSEIADLTYNVMAFGEIMQMIWKRLNDHGKNWRHVYKSLVLLDYLLKTGSERVAQQCRENLLSIQTLKDFQYVEDGKDHGQNVREKSKALVALLKDDERFKNERTKALSAKERYAQNTGTTAKAIPGKMPHSSSDRYLYASAAKESTQSHTGTTPPLSSDLEAVRPSSYGEEDLQLQLALAMSKEEHEEELKRRKGDELKLQMALEESRKLTNPAESPTKAGGHLLEFEASGGSSVAGGSKMSSSVTWDGHLSQVAVADPWSPKPTSMPASDPWGMPAVMPQQSLQPALSDPWAPPIVSSTTASSFDMSSMQPAKSSVVVSTAASPWDPMPSNGAHNGTHGVTSGTVPGSGIDDEFDMLVSRSKSPSSGMSGVPPVDLLGEGFGGVSSKGGSSSLGGAWDLSEFDTALGGGHDASAAKKKSTTAEEFLGQNANLVNLNELIARPPPSGIINPFAMTTTPAGNPRTQSPAANLFATRALQEEQSRRVPINQMAKTQTPFPAGCQQPVPSVTVSSLPTPLMPGTAWQTPLAGGSFAPAAQPYSVAVPAQPFVVQPSGSAMYSQPLGASSGIQPYPQSQNPFL